MLKRFVFLGLIPLISGIVTIVVLGYLSFVLIGTSLINGFALFSILTFVAGAVALPLVGLVSGSLVRAKMQRYLNGGTDPAN